jgi:hypothetical protein
MVMGITETLFKAARECAAQNNAPGAKAKLGVERQKALASGLNTAQIQTIEVAAVKASELQAHFGRKRER